MICKRCGNSFVSQDKRRKFCSIGCCWQWRSENKDQLKGAFKKGDRPYNAGTKGVSRPNRTSFKKGDPAYKTNCIGDIAYRKCKGVTRAWVKIADDKKSSDWILRAVKVWKDQYGDVPKGMVVHHKDRDTLNDAIDNLQVMTRAEHMEEHRHEFEIQRRTAIQRGDRA